MTEEKAVPRFAVKAINISRSYHNDSCFRAQVTVTNMYGNDITIQMPEDRVLQLIDVVSDLIVVNVQEQFGNMREDAVAAIEAKKAKELPAPVDSKCIDDDVPF
jgi:hypothetical protein